MLITSAHNRDGTVEIAANDCLRCGNRSLLRYIWKREATNQSGAFEGEKNRVAQPPADYVFGTEIHRISYPIPE